MGTIRTITNVERGHFVLEGAGVRLRRLFGFYDTAVTDPFLLFDHFGSDDPEDYIAGFPWHPHRGIETVTYMINGVVEHADSLGNKGAIGPGDVQWMTAGSGIIHQEMPKETSGNLTGFQLWINLPRSEKMTAPKYRALAAGSIPLISSDGCTVRIISGLYKGVGGAAEEIVGNPLYLDVTVYPGSEFRYEPPDGHTALAYVFQGSVIHRLSPDQEVADGMFFFSDCGQVVLKSAGKGARFIFLVGRPIREPVAWRGPIVMNTEEELDAAFKEYEEGIFIRKGN